MPLFFVGFDWCLEYQLFNDKNELLAVTRSGTFPMTSRGRVPGDQQRKSRGQKGRATSSEEDDEEEEEEVRGVVVTATNTNKKRKLGSRN